MSPHSSTLFAMISHSLDLNGTNLLHEYAKNAYLPSVSTVSSFTGTTTTVTSSYSTVHTSSLFAISGQITASRYAQRPICSYTITPSIPLPVQSTPILNTVCSDSVCSPVVSEAPYETTMTEPHNVSSHSSPGVHAKLPKISLPNFDGDPLKWDDFIDTFDITVHNRSIPDQEKMILLRQSLSGRAQLAIAKFRFCHYLKAYDHLKSRFGKPNIVVHQLVNELSEMSQAIDDLISLRDTVDRIQAIITLIDGYEESTNESVLHLLTSKFNLKLRIKIAKAMIRDQSGSKWSVLRLMNFSESYLMEQEELHARLSTTMFANVPAMSINPVISQCSQSISEHSASNTPSSRRQCIFCNSFFSDHSSLFCPNYKWLDERKQRLMKQGRCFNCSIVGHIAKECEYDPCSRCDHSRLHSKLICPSLIRTFRNCSSSRHRDRRSKCGTDGSISQLHSSPFISSASSDKEWRNKHDSSQEQISPCDNGHTGSDDSATDSNFNGDRQKQLLQTLIDFLKSDV